MIPCILSHTLSKLEVCILVERTIYFHFYISLPPLAPSTVVVLGLVCTDFYYCSISNSVRGFLRKEKKL